MPGRNGAAYNGVELTVSNSQNLQELHGTTQATPELHGHTIYELPGDAVNAKGNNVRE